MEVGNKIILDFFGILTSTTIAIVVFFTKEIISDIFLAKKNKKFILSYIIFLTKSLKDNLHYHHQDAGHIDFESIGNHYDKLLSIPQLEVHTGKIRRIYFKWKNLSYFTGQDKDPDAAAHIQSEQESAIKTLEAIIKELESVKKNIFF